MACNCRTDDQVKADRPFWSKRHSLKASEDPGTMRDSKTPGHTILAQIKLSSHCDGIFPFSNYAGRSIYLRAQVKSVSIEIEPANGGVNRAGRTEAIHAY